MDEKLQDRSTVVFAGTLGDAFIVFCKLLSISVTQGRKFSLIRYDLHPAYDGSIAELFRLAPSLHYQTPCTQFKTIPDIFEAMRTCPYPYVNSKWSRNDEETYSFDYTALNPFPELDLKIPSLPYQRPRIGVQLSCGMEGHNFRGFSLGWLRKLRRALPIDQFDIYLFGKLSSAYPQSYLVGDIEGYARRYGIVSLVNKLDFKDWLAHMRAMQYFISMEGFSAFFAMSQRVKVLLYNQQPYREHIDLSLHSAWQPNSLILDINNNKIRRKLRATFGISNLYSPEVPREFFT